MICLSLSRFAYTQSFNHRKPITLAYIKHKFRLHCHWKNHIKNKEKPKTIRKCINLNDIFQRNMSSSCEIINRILKHKSCRLLYYVIWKNLTVTLTWSINSNKKKTVISHKADKIERMSHPKKCNKHFLTHYETADFNLSLTTTSHSNKPNQFGCCLC